MDVENAIKLEKELRLGDLVRIWWNSQIITGFFKDIHVHYNRGKPKWAYITLLARVPNHPELDASIRTEGLHSYSFDEGLLSVEVITRVLSPQWFAWEEVK